jgi:hypothetical protein
VFEEVHHARLLVCCGVEGGILGETGKSAEERARCGSVFAKEWLGIVETSSVIFRIELVGISHNSNAQIILITICCEKNDEFGDYCGSLTVVLLPSL